MRTFISETALAAVELKQMVADYCRELDVNGGLSLTQYFTEDCIVEVGAISYKGHAAMKQHYLDHADAVRAMGGHRQQCHGFSNFRVSFPEKDRATITYLVINFSSKGKAPVMNATTPTIVTDCRFECRRDADGQWLIFGFYGAPIFVGNDPYLTKAVVS